MIAAPSDIRNAIRVYYGAGPAVAVVPAGVSPKAVSKPPAPQPLPPVSSVKPDTSREEPAVPSPEPPPVADEDVIEDEESGPPTELEDPQTVEVRSAKLEEGDRRA